MEGRVTIFLSGKMISTGAKSIERSVDQLKKALKLLIKNNLVVRTRLTPQVRNIVATANFEASLDIKAIATVLHHITYEPDQFPGLVLLN
jgi:transcription initiation factor TFIID TATA-box-binding protein